MSFRALRPFAQAMRTSALGFARPPIASRAAAASAVNAQLQSKKGQMTMLHAAMPQLIPFYFVNETATAFILLPTLIYIMSKYVLPQNVRLMAARLFVSKL